MNFLIKLLVSTLAVIITAWLLGSGVEVRNDSVFIAILIAAVLAFLNSVVKPILILLTIPITVFTLGIFLLVINAGMIMLADRLIDGFSVKNFWWALWFSIVLSIVNGLLSRLGKDSVNRRYR
jgi:putative membrane protein